VEPLRLGLLAVILYAPVLAVPVVLFAAFKGRSGIDDRAALFCESVASELRSGLSLQQAVESGAISVGVSVPHHGARGTSPFQETVEGIEQEFPEIGRELRATVEASARSGGGAAAVFDEVGSMAIAQAEIAREVEAASAPARATAWFFVVVPAGYVTLQLRSGSLAGALEAPEQRLAAGAGLALFLAGLAAVVFMMWRAR
jgi:Flp pilus assembly protein TadB